MADALNEICTTQGREEALHKCETHLPGFQILVHLSRCTITIDGCQPWHLVEELQCKVGGKSGIPSAQIFLTHSGNLLELGCKLEQFGLCAGVPLHLATRGCGGTYDDKVRKEVGLWPWHWP